VRGGRRWYADWYVRSMREAAEGRAGADRMARGLPSVPTGRRGGGEVEALAAPPVPAEGLSGRWGRGDEVRYIPRGIDCSAEAHLA